MAKSQKFKQLENELLAVVFMRLLEEVLRRPMFTKVDRRGVHGAPDLVIEILSPSTAQCDRLIKFNLYQRAGVREYWIIDSAARMVSVYTLKDSYYRAAAYGSDSSVQVDILDDCTIDLSTVFPET